MTVIGKLAGHQGRALDDRLGLAKVGKSTMRKVFPDHWSFLLGEIALYSFIILLLTGVFLTFFFDPSVKLVTYNGSYVPLKGVEMTQAYASTLNISFDVRGGLLIRQIHHWAALLFVAAIGVHMCRIFFTGAFRKPREINWTIGVGLLTLALLEGFAGYSLPDDLLSGSGLRIAFSIVESIPVVGTYAGFFLFGGNYPGPQFIPRLFTIHVLLIPGILLALISAHMIILVRQKHTQFPGPGKTEHNVVGSPLYPGFSLKTGGFFMLIFGLLSILSAAAQINPVWLYGPYNPSQVSAGTQPDWYIGWLDGTLRLMPNIEWNFAHHYTLSMNILFPAVILIPKRICLGLQRRDRDRLEHGEESGTIRMLPTGEFIEVHTPVEERERIYISASAAVSHIPELEATIQGRDGDGNGRRPIPTGPAAMVEAARRKIIDFFYAETDEEPEPEHHTPAVH